MKGFEQIVPGCGHFTTETGNIQSPNFPGLASNNAQCTWTIRLEPGKIIVLHFHDFNVSCNGYLQQYGNRTKYLNLYAILG